mgnify:CR=1 FL=1
MASINDICQRVKAHPAIAGTNVTSLPDDDFAFAVGQLIFPCLDELSLRVGGDPFTKHYAFTDPASVAAVLDAEGATSLATLITTNGLMLESLHNGEIRHPSSDYPLVRLAHAGVGAGNWDSFGYLHYWLVGTKLFTRSSDDNVTPLTGSLTFACPRSDGLDTLNVGLEGMLVDMLRGSPLKEAEPK